MTLKVFLDFMSQPSRALLLFVRAASIPHELKPIRIAKAEHRSPEFTKMSQFQTVRYPYLAFMAVILRTERLCLSIPGEIKIIYSYSFLDSLGTGPMCLAETS